MLDVERVAYERAFGRIESNGTLLQLLINDPWFAWLRPLSALIVQIDEWLEADDATPGSRELGESLLTKVREILRPSEEGDRDSAPFRPSAAGRSSDRHGALGR